MAKAIASSYKASFLDSISGASLEYVVCVVLAGCDGAGAGALQPPPFPYCFNKIVSQVIYERSLPFHVQPCPVFVFQIDDIPIKKIMITGWAFSKVG